MDTVKPFLLVLASMVLAGCGGGDAAGEKQAGTEAAVAAHPGEQIYLNYCFSCHTPGLSGAPRLGDVDAWGARIAKGPALLLAATIEGIPPAMPPRGMCFNCSDEDLAAAVDFMIINSQ